MAMFKDQMTFLGRILLISFLGSTLTYGLTVYDFGASWCAPCKGDIARDNNLKNKFGDQVTFVFVDEDVDSSQASQFITITHPNFDVKMDPSHDFAKSMGAVNKTPAVVIVDDKGGIEIIKRFIKRRCSRI